MNCYAVMFENVPVRVIVEAPFLEYMAEESWAELVAAESRGQARYLAGRKVCPGESPTDYPIKHVGKIKDNIDFPKGIITDAAPIEWWTFKFWGGE